MTAITTDVKSLSETIKDRMEGKIGEFMPDEVFDKLLEAAVSDLVTPKKDQYNRGQNKPSRIQEMIAGAIEDHLKVKIDKELSSDKWERKFDQSGSHITGEVVEKLIKKHSVDMFQSVMENMVTVAVDYAMVNLQNRNNNY